MRKAYPRLPEEWIDCIKKKLLSDSELAFVGAHLGITDVLLYTLEKERFTDSPMLPPVNGPPPLSCIAQSFLAIVGSLASNAVCLFF